MITVLVTMMVWLAMVKRKVDKRATGQRSGGKKCLRLGSNNAVHVQQSDTVLNED